jgi:hypothetical protein
MKCRQKCQPCVSSQSKGQMFSGSGDRLISACMPFNFTKFHKAKSVEFIRVCIDSFIRMSGTGRDGDDCPCGNSHAVGKRERTQRETPHRNCEEAIRKICILYLGYWGKKSNERRVKPSSRRDSLRKLSILYILSIPAFVQPSSLVTVSISLRSGSIYSELERRRYKTCMTVYWHAMIRLLYGKTGRHYGCEIGYE